MEVLPSIPSGCVDMILCDLPYGTTACKWDSIIPFEPLWREYERIIKPNGAIVLTASQPFTSALVMSNLRGFKYCWVWEKSRFSNPYLAKHQPLRITEDVCVFHANRYFPQGLVEFNQTTRQGERISDNYWGETRAGHYLQTHTNYPKNILRFKNQGNQVHPTQKPVALFEYLIRTYTDELETVLDNCMGSGTTGVACANTGRDFIGIERDRDYFKIAKVRIAAARKNCLSTAR